jgi:hypothetical protein
MQRTSNHCSAQGTSKKMPAEVLVVLALQDCTVAEVGWHRGLMLCVNDCEPCVEGLRQLLKLTMLMRQSVSQFRQSVRFRATVLTLDQNQAELA